MSSRVVKILRKQIPVLIQAMKSNCRANTLVKKLERNNCKKELDVPNTGMYVSQKLETIAIPKMMNTFASFLVIKYFEN